MMNTPDKSSWLCRNASSVIGGGVIILLTAFCPSALDEVNQRSDILVKWNQWENASDDEGSVPRDLWGRRFDVRGVRVNFQFAFLCIAASLVAIPFTKTCRPIFITSIGIIGISALLWILLFARITWESSQPLALTRVGWQLQMKSHVNQ
ncbi:MAG: hypothetical protein R3C03_06745 [Pirellulaceae bacterium]